MRDLLISPRHQHQVVNGSLRVVDMPSLGAYDLVTGQGYSAGKYTKSPWAFACMQIRGNELANLPWHLVERSTGKIIDRHPIIDMLTEFGPESNYRESVLATEIDLCSLAKAFWLRDVDIIRRLHPGTIRVDADKTGIKRFVQTINNKETSFDRDEIIYFHEYNPDSDLLPGPSIMDIVKTPISIEAESRFYAEAFFKNDATPSILLTSDQPISEPEMDRIKSWWEKTFRGAKKAHKTGFADRGMKAQVLSSTMKDIALTAIHDQAVNDICVGFRVPRLLAGQFTEATYANANEARVYLLENVIIPRSRVTYEDTINFDLVWKIDPNVSLRFAPQELAILQEGQNKKWERLSDALDKGAISPEFARIEMGWPETAAPAEAPIPVTDTVFDAEARSWARKAKKALKAGKSANVEFESYELPAERQAAIRAKLATASTAAEVDEAFE